MTAETKLADQLQRLCCAETEGKFFDCVTDNIAAIIAGLRDAERLDWLDAVNTRTNERVGTCYGWKFDINHNRAALSDCNLPALHVRATIDQVRLVSTRLGEGMTTTVTSQERTET